MRRAILIILVIGMTAGTTFDDLVQQVRGAKDETSASPDDIVIAPEDEAGLLDNNLGGDTFLKDIYFNPHWLS